jgi:hypothetical protein
MASAFMTPSLKSVPAFSLSPNGGEGQGEGEVIFTASSNSANLWTVKLRITTIIH